MQVSKLSDSCSSYNFTSPRPFSFPSAKCGGSLKIIFYKPFHFVLLLSPLLLVFFRASGSNICGILSMLLLGTLLPNQLMPPLQCSYFSAQVIFLYYISDCNALPTRQFSVTPRDYSFQYSKCPD